MVMAISVAAILGATVPLIVSTLVRSASPPRDDARLARIERQQQAILEHLGIAMPEPDLPEVVEHLTWGRKIRAIQAYREATGLGLKESKAAVEEIARQYGR